MHNILNKSFEINVTKSESKCSRGSLTAYVYMCMYLYIYVYAHTHTHTVCVCTVQYSINATTFCGL